MATWNNVTLAGNLTRPVELRFLPSQVAIAEFAVAVNERWKDTHGQVQSKVSFIECKAWRGLAEVIAKHFRKGDPILLGGKLEQERWNDKNTGEAKSRTVVVVEEFTFIGGNKNANNAQQNAGGKHSTPPVGQPGYQAPQSYQQPPMNQTPPGAVPIPDDADIPF